MDNIPDKIREQNPSLADFSVTSTVVTTMRRIVGSIVKNHYSGGNWLISEAIVDTVRLYIYCYGGKFGDFLNMELDQMVEEKDGLGEDIHLRKNLEETHTKMREILKSKLEK